MHLISRRLKGVQIYTPPWGGGGYTLTWAIYVCAAQKVWFFSFLFINRVKILADFSHFGHKYGLILYSSIDMGMSLKCI